MLDDLSEDKKNYVPKNARKQQSKRLDIPEPIMKKLNKISKIPEGYELEQAFLSKKLYGECCGLRIRLQALQQGGKVTRADVVHIDTLIDMVTGKLPKDGGDKAETLIKKFIEGPLKALRQDLDAVIPPAQRQLEPGMEPGIR